MCSDGEEHHELARNQLGAARVIVPFPPPYKRKAQTPTPPIRKQFLLREQLEAMLCSHGKKGILFFTLFFCCCIHVSKAGTKVEEGHRGNKLHLLF